MGPFWIFDAWQWWWQFAGAGSTGNFNLKSVRTGGLLKWIRLILLALNVTASLGFQRGEATVRPIYTLTQWLNPCLFVAPCNCPDNQPKRLIVFSIVTRKRSATSYPVLSGMTARIRHFKLYIVLVSKHFPFEHIRRKTSKGKAL